MFVARLICLRHELFVDADLGMGGLQVARSRCLGCGAGVPDSRFKNRLRVLGQEIRGLPFVWGKLTPKK